jgi:hypothetical protein
MATALDSREVFVGSLVPPLFFVSVAFKGFRYSGSPLKSTLRLC